MNPPDSKNSDAANVTKLIIRTSTRASSNELFLFRIRSDHRLNLSKRTQLHIEWVFSSNSNQGSICYNTTRAEQEVSECGQAIIRKPTPARSNQGSLKYESTQNSCRNESKRYFNRFESSVHHEPT